MRDEITHRSQHAAVALAQLRDGRQELAGVRALIAYDQYHPVALRGNDRGIYHLSERRRIDNDIIIKLLERGDYRRKILAAEKFDGVGGYFPAKNTSSPLY